MDGLVRVVRARQALGIVVLGRLFGQHKRRLNGQASCAADQVVAIKEVQCVVEALLAHVGQNLGVWREQDPHEAVDVLP